MELLWNGEPELKQFYMGKSAKRVQALDMSANAQPDNLAMFLAEEILRAIYGDDYKGCQVDPATIAKIIQASLDQNHAQHQDLIGLYEKVVEAIHLLSTPPDVSKVKDPDELRKLLSERLDGIHAITAKTMQTTALVRPKGQGG